MNFYLVMAKIVVSDSADDVKADFEPIYLHVMYVSGQKLNKKLATDEVVAHLQKGLILHEAHKESYTYSVSLTQFKKIPVDTIVKH